MLLRQQLAELVARGGDTRAVGLAQVRAARSCRAHGCAGVERSASNAMSVLHVTEAEMARDLHGVLEKVRNGAEVIIEQDARPIAALKAVPRAGWTISECIALAKAQRLEDHDGP